MTERQDEREPVQEALEAGPTLEPHALAPALPSWSSAAGVLAMQQGAGNAAVARVLAREPTATAPAATGRWNAPFGMGGFGNTPEASAALIDVSRELKDLAESGYPDVQPLSEEGQRLATELVGDSALTAEQADKLNEYTGRVSVLADPALAELKQMYLAQLAEWKAIEQRAQETEDRLAEKLHHDFMDAASESVVSKTKEALGKSKEYAGKAKDYAGYVEKVKGLIPAAEKIGRLKKVAEGLEEKAGEAQEVVELAESVLTIAGQIGEAPGQYASDVSKLKAGMQIASFAVDKAKIPLIGDYFKFITTCADKCLNGVMKIAQLIDDSNRMSRKDQFLEAIQSGGPAPRLDTSVSEDLAHTWPGGQAMLNFMWELMRDDDAVNIRMTTELEDYFIKFRSQFNAGEKEEIETDTHWYNPATWFGRTTSSNLKKWLVGHKGTVWSQLYGSLPHP